MCGIVGIFDPRGGPSEDELRGAIGSLRDRGPDHQQTISLDHIALGHTRLAIIDLVAASNQPMSDISGKVWTVFNGEIYNFREVRKELEARGAVFKTRSDTEVLLEAYKAWGAGCVEHLNGMFAFAIWDQRSNTVLLARDRLGEKPLFYCKDNRGRLLFASTLTALRKIDGCPDKLDVSALNQFLSVGYVLTDKCIIEGVRKLAPGYRMVCDLDGHCRSECYWDLQRAFATKRQFRSEDEAADELAALIDDAVQMRLVGDVPLGTFLSGGIDSATIVAAMSRHIAPGELRTFTIGFDQPDFNELEDARSTALHLKTNHVEHLVDLNQAASVLPKVMRCVGEPFADSSIIPTYYVSELARRDTAFCLSGDGADEILAGYETYKADRIHRLSSWFPAQGYKAAARALDLLVKPSFGKVTFDYKLGQFLRGQGLSEVDAHYFWRVLFDAPSRARLLGGANEPGHDDAQAFFRGEAAKASSLHYLDRAMYVDIKTWLVDDILVKVDRASMANSLEVRAPFLDHRLVEFAASLPIKMKMPGLKTKYLLRKSQRARLPAKTLLGRKRGFNAPVARWLLGEFGELARDATTSGPILNCIEKSEVIRLWRDHTSGQRDNSFRLYALASLGIWLAEV